MSLPEFRNEPGTNFEDSTRRDLMRRALADVRLHLGTEFSLIIGAERKKGGGTFTSINPANPNEVVAVGQLATPSQVSEAVETASQGFHLWRQIPPEEKMALFLKAAGILRRRRFEAAAWLVFEVGKNWAEADGEVAGAIDELEYVAREILRYAEGKPTTVHASEVSFYRYVPLGVVIVISPWNFPLVTSMGMALGAIGAGNSVILKPSSDSLVSAYLFHEVMEEAGLPPGVLNVVTGQGRAIGDALVDHPKTRMIAFTGSKEVGCRIYERAAKVWPGQHWLKRVIAEMGGKNAIVVDDEGDVKAAVAAAVVAGYGYQGQNCSACSRLVVTRNVYHEVVEAFTEQVRSLKLGPGEENFPIGPVINARAMESILSYIRIGKSEGKLMCGGERGDGPGFYIQPTVIADVDQHARVAQEEIFGPVVSVVPAEDFEDALQIANGTEYGLTGAVFTRNPAKIARAWATVVCGNLWINRKCSGGEIGVTPFGGFNMSGTDAKLGGPDYLLYFLQPTVVSIKYG